MTILTVSQLVAAFLPAEPITKDSGTGEASGEMYSTWYSTGRPGAGSAPAGGLNGTARSATVTGQLPFPSTVSGKAVYIAGIDAVTTGGFGTVMVYDRLWDNSSIGITTTTAQSVTSPTWPARDLDGATSGRGIQLGFEVSAATGNGGAITNTTVSYTNSSGTSGRTGTVTSFPATAVAGTFVPVMLAAGDVGVQSVQSITLGTTYVSGTMHLVAYRHLATVPLPSAGSAARLDALNLGLPRVYDSSVPWLVYVLNSTTVGRFSGAIQYAQG